MSRTAVLVTLATATAGAGGLASMLAGHDVTAGRLIATITQLTVMPNTAPGPVATLAATEAAANGAHPAGWVQFQAGGTAVGSIAVTLSVPISGDFTVTVPADTVTLQGSANSGIATGSLQTITVSEGRNWAPDWSVSGQNSDFPSKGRAAHRTIPGTELGWVPSGAVTDGATLGPTVRPGSPGLGSAGALLAVAKGSGFGTQTLGAELTLIIPGSGTAAPYSGLLTITYLEAASLPASSGQTSFPQAG